MPEILVTAEDEVEAKEIPEETMEIIWEKRINIGADKTTPSPAISIIPHVTIVVGKNTLLANAHLRNSQRIK